MRRLPSLITAVALGLASAAAAAPAALAQDRAASCTALQTAGTVNDLDLVPFAQIPEAGSLAQWPAAPQGLLPQRVFLRGTQESFNARYAFATRDGEVYAAPRDGGAPGWHRLPLPDCFAGRVTAISADDDELIAIDDEHRIFTMDNALKGPDLFNWSRRWGPPFWTGTGRTLPQGIVTWSWSVLSPAEDRTWTDVGGTRHQVGARKVSHIWALRDGGRRLTFMDPWLPADESYELCAPHGGRLRPVSLSASGSAVFVAGRDGDLFTRLYDFDLAGHNPVYLRYVYERPRAVQGTPPVQLPAPAWVRQPKVPGTITSAISIEKRGVGALRQTLRVEGRDRQGRSGYWEKDSLARRASAWRFHRTGLPLRGRRLANPQRDSSRDRLAPTPGVDYRTRLDGLRVQVLGFDPHCSPARLRIGGGAGAGKPVELRLHSADGLRQTPRSPDLDAEPRLLSGVIELAPAQRRRLARMHEPAAGRLLALLGGRRFADVPLTATARALELGGELDWRLTR